MGGMSLDFSATGPKLFLLPILGQNASSSNATISDAACSAREVSDEFLLQRLQAGDSEALSSLFRRYASLVRGIGRRLLRDDAEAEDLVQEVFLFLFDKSATFDSTRGSARSWIVQNIYYRAINRRRYLSSRHQLFVKMNQLAVSADVETSSYEHSGNAIFDGALVQEILKTLTSDQFETVRLFFFEGYTLSEISEKLGQPLGNVRHHYYRGLDKLKARLFPE
jgi:RNA polymerase sigma-70 factor (ECF subfamily)